MDTKDYVVLAGTGVTLLLGLWNFVQGYRATRKASFINTVTSQRVLWIEQLRQNMASFIGLTHHWTASELEGTPAEADVLKEIDRLRYVIRLSLNPDDTHDRKIAALVKKIPDLTHQSRAAQLAESLEALTVATQQLITAEWNKVKAESKHGDLKDL